MTWTRRSLMAAGGILSASPSVAQVVEVGNGCADVPPFGLPDVDAVLPEPTTGPRPQVACFYYQSWYSDPERARLLGITKYHTEWDRVAETQPVVSCEIQPKLPAWGPFDGSDPRAVEREVAAASGAGIDAFVFTWRYANGRSVANACLDRAFLQAGNRHSMHFAVMWVNYNDIEAKLNYETHDWALMADNLLGYAKQPNYWKIAGKPVFGIYSFRGLMGAYGPDVLRQKLATIVARARDAGLPGVYLFCGVDYKSALDPGASGFDAATMYMALGLTPFGLNPRNTVIPYRDAAAQVPPVWLQYAGYQSVPFFPSCPVGWDNSSRVGNKARMVVHRSAEQYEALLVAAKRFVWRQRYNPGIIFLSSWNEWGEDHYLLPDKTYGDTYLQAVRRALGRA